MVGSYDEINRWWIADIPIVMRNVASDPENASSLELRFT